MSAWWLGLQVGMSVGILYCVALDLWTSRGRR